VLPLLDPLFLASLRFYVNGCPLFEESTGHRGMRNYVGKVPRCRLDAQGAVPDRDTCSFGHLARPVVGPTQALGSHSSPSIVEVAHAWNFSTTSHIHLHCMMPRHRHSREEVAVAGSEAFKCVASR